MSNTRRNIRSALRAGLKREDASMAERLPAVPTPAVLAPTTAAAAVPAPAVEAAPPSVPPAEAAAKPARSKKKKSDRLPSAVAVLAARALERRTGSAGAALVAEAALAIEAAHQQRAAEEDGATAKDGDGRAKKGKKLEKREKVVRDSFSLPKSEQARLKRLRARLARSGRIATKSEVLRAALQLLSQRSTEELVTLLDALPAVPKGKKRK